MPEARFSYMRLRRLVRVSGFLAEVTQQMNSLRARGVMSSHV